MFNWLVSGAIFAETNAVMCKNKNGWDMRQSRKANSGSHVIRENEESRAVGDHAAEDCHAVQCRAHGMFTHTKVEVAPLGILLEGRAAFDFCVVRGARSAEPPINSGSLRASALITLPEAARVAMPFGSAGKTGKAVSQSSGSSPFRRRCNSAPMRDVIACSHRNASPLIFEFRPRSTALR